jgi:hypothetical protein
VRHSLLPVPALPREVARTFLLGHRLRGASSCTRACTLMIRGALCASLQRASTAQSFFCKALFSVVRCMSTTAIAERTVPCSAQITLCDRTSPPSSLRGACACAGAGRGLSARTQTCRTGGDTPFQSRLSLHWRVCIVKLCGAGTLQPRPCVCATASQSRYVRRLKTGCSWWC